MHPNPSILLGSRRRALLTVLAWLALVAALTALAPSLDSVEDNSAVNLPPAAADSMAARALEAQAFPEGRGVPAVVVVHDPEGLGDGGEQAVAAVREELADMEPSPAVVSDDGTTAIVAVAVAEPPSSERFHDTVDDVRRVADEAVAQSAAESGQDGLTSAVTGPAGISRDAVEVFGSGDRTLLLGTVVLVLVLLLAVYRSPLLALVPLVSAALAIRTTEALAALGAEAGLLDVNSQTASIMTVLLFGIGTDYTLLVAARYREALGEQATGAANLPAAMLRAMAGVGRTLVFSASTVVLALLALLLAVSPALRGFGPFLALSVAVMLAAALTLVPALVLVCGRAVLWPRRPGRAAGDGGDGGDAGDAGDGEHGDHRAWSHVADLVQRRPRRVLAASLAVLGIFSLGLTGYSETYDLVSGFRAETESAQGQAILDDAFPPGALAPTRVYVDLAGSSPRPDQLAGVAEALAAVDVVAGVAPAEVSADGSTARYTLTLATDPYGDRALDAVDELRTAAGAAVADVGLPDRPVLVGEETAVSADQRAALQRDLLVLVPVVVLAVLLVLGVMLRSLLAPLYLAGSILLSFAATMGVTTFVATTVLGDEGIGNRVTAYVFVFLVALGVDYNIFVMDRFAQEARSHPPARALRTAIVRTGGVVTSAGVVLAGTFLVLTTQPVRELFQFGLAMAVGILVDTLLVRTLLVPAVVQLLGRRALWPARPGSPVAPQVSPAAASVPGAHPRPGPVSPPAADGRPRPGTTAAGRAPR